MKNTRIMKEELVNVLGNGWEQHNLEMYWDDKE